MKDLEGEKITVETMPYAARGGRLTTKAICIADIDGRLVPLIPDQARKLAVKLIRAANKADSG